MSTTTQRLARLTLTGTLCALTVLMTACGGGDGGSSSQVLRTALATGNSTTDGQPAPAEPAESARGTLGGEPPHASGTSDLAEIAAEVEPLALVPGVTLDTHPVSVDGSGKLLSWVTPQDHAFDRVSFLSWDMLLNRMPLDPANGLKVIYTHSEYSPTTLDGSSWPNNPAGKNAMLAESAALYYAYSGNRAVIDLVRGLLDHQLQYGTTPATSAWAKVPWSTAKASSITYGNDTLREGSGVVEPDKVGELGFNGYLRFWQITGDVRYRDAAIACADALLKNLRGNTTASRSPWPFRVNAQSGSSVEDYGSHVIAPIRLFDELIRLNLGNVAGYTTARQAVWTWLMTYPMTNNRWNQYFEDVPRSSNLFSNFNQYAPGQTARYLLENPSTDAAWKTKVSGLINYIETRFGNDYAGDPGLYYGARVISEQTAYMFKMASHTSRFGAVNALYAAATGDAIAKDKAFRSLNWATYMARDNGTVNEGPAESKSGVNFWFTDGHGDYVRHFMIAMGAFPEWAPAGENHLLRSSSVISAITYAPDSINYDTFDAAATEVLRVNSQPQGVSAGGLALPQRADVNAAGWTYDSATGVLKVRHDSGTHVQVVLNASLVPPTLSITSPANGSVLIAPAQVTVSALASDNGRVTHVEFFSGSTLINDIANPPYQFSWGPLAVGNYTLTARATDDDGLSSTASVDLSVVPVAPPAPVVIMGSNAEGTTTDYITDASGAYINANRVQAQASVAATTLKAKVGAIAGHYQFAVFADSNGVPGSKLADTGEVNATTTGWQVYPLSAPLPVTSGQWYWIAVWSNDVNARVSATSGSLRWGAYPYSTTWPNPPVLRGSAPFAYSIYATDGN
ncbi:MAG: hypothetical protein B7Y51_00640 [Burkholderiales bacterium 28-67-8]|nr:MAG: hypothetical protein B7Y51_00640 [Burkholderiales bacterium 28-67-8]